MANESQLLRIDVCRPYVLRLEHDQQDYSDNCRFNVYCSWFLSFCTCFRFLGKTWIVHFASI